jgi:hypothetical protein
MELPHQEPRPYLGAPFTRVVSPDITVANTVTSQARAFRPKCLLLTVKLTRFGVDYLQPQRSATDEHGPICFEQHPSTAFTRTDASNTLPDPSSRHPTTHDGIRHVARKFAAVDDRACVVISKCSHALFVHWPINRAEAVRLVDNCT